MNRDQVTVAFTGAAGRVGRQVIGFLKDHWKIKGLDLKPESICDIPIHPADLLDPEATLEALRGTGAIVHCAIASYPNDGNANPESAERKEYHRNMLDVNIKGTYHIFEAARILRIPQVVYISSLTVVTGHLPEQNDLDESLSPNPRNLYACTKLFGEQMAHLYSRAYGINTICLRLGQPYPLGLLLEEEWKKDPYARAGFVSHADIARAIDCALRARHITRGVYNIVSRNASGVISHDGAKEIGFEPHDFC